MIKLVALYTHPADPAAFDAHYTAVHAPLVRKLPNLKRFEVAHVTGMLGGASPYYFIAELYWDDKAAMDADMTSAEMRAAAADLPTFADGLATLHVAEVLT